MMDTASGLTGERTFMTRESFEVVPVAHVVGGRIEPTDDFWGGTQSIIRIDRAGFGPDSTAGLEEFSHLEVVFRFHLTDPTDLHLGARRAKDNPDWPAVGIFGHRDMCRLNWLGVSRCRLLKVDGLDLHVEDLDAVDGTPVLDINPWFAEMGPRGEIRQAPWSLEMLARYYANPSRMSCRTAPHECGPLTASNRQMGEPVAIGPPLDGS
jgi:tRNA (Thr-GGU) A37 N-methylase